MAAPEGPASPEEVFLAWLLSLPGGVDVSSAAAAEIVRLDHARLRSARGKKLRQLFLAATKCAVPRGRVS
jgi:hypothetical protein